LHAAAKVVYIEDVSTVTEISAAIAKLSAREQIELLKSVAGHLKLSPDDVVRSMKQNGAGAANDSGSPSAASMLGFAKRFHPDDSRTSDDILRELREGDTQ
jgi:hypothetical protein